MCLVKYVSAGVVLMAMMIAAAPVVADVYVFDPDEVVLIHENEPAFTFGKSAFDAAGFDAAVGDTIKLKIRHKLNANDPATEQWGLWFYDSLTDKTIQIKKDPNHLLDPSDAGWVSSSFNLSKAKILDPLYSNAGDWWFFLQEVTVGTVNTLKFDQAKLVVSTPAPIPGAVWLFGSGLALAIGVARRKQQHG